MNSEDAYTAARKKPNCTNCYVECGNLLLRSFTGNMQMLDMKPGWMGSGSRRPGTSFVPQGLGLGSVQCDIFISDVEEGTEWTLSTSVYKTNLGWVYDTAESCALIWRGLNTLENWADRNLLKFSREKCKFLHLWKNVYHCVLGPPARKQFWRGGIWDRGGWQAVWASTV